MTQLCQRQDELRRYNTEVLLISFGGVDLAAAWLKETCPVFHLALDSERASYRVYGLEHSLRRSWSAKTIWRYAQLLLSGWRWRGIQGDTGQLGGDFIIDATGGVRLAHRSHDPTDRPPVDELLAILHGLAY